MKMYSYVLSRLRLRENLKDVDPKEILDEMSPPPSKFRFSSTNILEMKWGKGLKLAIIDPVSVFFSFMEFPVQVDLTTVANLILDEEGYLMVSSPRGIGLITKGKPRNYIDTSISQVVLNSFFPNKAIYEPYHFEEDEMRMEKWGTELRELEVNKYNFGRVLIHGKLLNKKLKSEYPIGTWILDGMISRLKVYSDFLGRNVVITSAGVLRSSVDDIDLISEFVLKCIEDGG